MDLYSKYKPVQSGKAKLDSDLLNLIKYFISSSCALKSLTNPYLRKAMKFPLPCELTFRQKILPNLRKDLEEIFEHILNKSFCASLIPDNWSDQSMTSYMGIAIFSIDLNYERDVFVIGMKEVYGKHNSEKPKETIDDF